MQKNNKSEILLGLKKYLPEMIEMNKKALKIKGPEYHWRAVMVDLWDWELDGTKYTGMTKLYISTNDTQNWRLQFRRGNAERIRLEKRMTTEELFDLIRQSIVYVRGIG
ncbi:hypothetical protein [Priestia megaterium]|uniref:Uncharacterized protein n=1 Tax=Priestia megaterium TaxID=1404 RepID=A0A6M6DZH9_PRIMG|nr:hypothetical protein [Priestia megaterium]QJX80303.1 hypothetical protein FDZ14_29880 [Priestia megaterium]